jgi:hypothetical protein
MFVGTSKLDLAYLRKIFKEPDRIREYSNSLIPPEFSHVRELRDNQLYLICMTIRKLGLNDYREVHSTIHDLLKGVRVTGYVDDIVDISFIYNIVNMDKVNLYLERL